MTVRLHLTDDPATDARNVATGAQQGAVQNRTVEHLLRNGSDESLQKSTGRGITGLQERWLTWRKEELGLRNIRSRTARGTIAAAADQVAKWVAVNERHAIAVARAADNGEPIPRSIQCRRVNPWRLYRRRKLKERRGRHLVRVDDGVRRIDRHTISLLPLESWNGAMTHKKDRRRHDQEAETSERSR